MTFSLMGLLPGSCREPSQQLLLGLSLLDPGSLTIRKHVLLISVPTV